jgi:bifunctional oligoribonuclease and PAP phosphatase NrnA
MEISERLKALLQNPGKVIITTHQKPDADALGSSLALSGILKKLGHQVLVISPTDYPQFLSWMPGEQEVVNFLKDTDGKCEKEIQEADLIYCLDFSSLDRINSLGKMVSESAATKVLIDHHIGKEDFAEFEFWSVKASSTAELTYDFIQGIGAKDKLDSSLAEALYAGVMTDTGSFRFPSTSKKVHYMIAELMDIGISHSKIHRLIYDHNRIGKLQLLGYVLYKKLKVLPEFATAYIALSEEELEQFNSQTGDTEGFVNYALSIDGVIFSAMITDREGERRMSFRSVGDFDVNSFARDQFEGGGHKNAAGGRSGESLENVIKKFEGLLPQYKEDLNKVAQIEKRI